MNNNVRNFSAMNQCCFRKFQCSTIENLHLVFSVKRTGIKEYKGNTTCSDACYVATVVGKKAQNDVKYQARSPFHF